MSRHVLRVINLGKRSHADVAKTQEMLRKRVFDQTHSATSASQKSNSSTEEPIENLLLLVEHWPVYTAGT